MSNPDWSKAPDDATHYHPAMNGYVEHWCKQDHFCVLGFEGDGWKFDSRTTPTNEMVARPAEQEKPIPGTAAFPSPGVVLNPGGHNPQQQGAYEGMSLRDYFAAKAMQGMLAYPGDASMGSHHNNNDAQGVAKMAYQYADAMLAERAK